VNKHEDNNGSGFLTEGMSERPDSDDGKDKNENRHGVEEDDEMLEVDLQGASYTQGGIFWGRAIGNAYNMADHRKLNFKLVIKF
jgi:hypothetical protein